jgi:uncharacterized protein YndB with AHSA1/START domain
MLRFALRALLVLLAIIGIVVLVGYALPVSHVAAREATLPVAPDRVFAALTDVEAFPRWRSGVERVETLAREPHPRWREHGSDAITFEEVERAAPGRLVTRIADPSLPFGGTWTYELTPDGAGTRLTITERGEVYNPVFRFLSRFVFGHTATIEQYLADLRVHLGA